MRKMWIVMLTAASLVGAAQLPAQAARFSDVPSSHVFASQIEWLATDGITTGYPDGTFRPGQAVLREQMAAFLYRLAGQPAVSDLPTTSPFTDVPRSHPFYAAIVWLSDAGISTGYPDGSFRPSQPVLREQMAAFLFRFRSLKAAPTSDQGPGPTSFADTGTNTFRDQIRWLSRTEISTGYSDGTFRPTQPVLREQMAAFLFRYDDRYIDAPLISGPFTHLPTPTIIGTAMVGSRLRGVAGNWAPEPETVTYTWLRNGEEIPGATSLGYTVRQADVGQSLRFRATAMRPGTAGSAITSAPLERIQDGASEIQRILTDTNAFRALHGKPALALHPDITTVAGNWASHMGRTCDYRHNPSFSTQIPGGWSSAAENIAAGQQYTNVVQAWIDSPGHRANLLGDFTHIGVGSFSGSACQYSTYFVQVFARYR